MVTKKIKSLLALKGFSFADYARALGILPQSLNSKTKKDAYKVNDLILLAELTGTKLAFIDDEGKAVFTFEKEDIKKEED